MTSFVDKSTLVPEPTEIVEPSNVNLDSAVAVPSPSDVNIRLLPSPTY